MTFGLQVRYRDVQRRKWSVPIFFLIYIIQNTHLNNHLHSHVPTAPRNVAFLRQHPVRPHFLPPSPPSTLTSTFPYRNRLPASAGFTTMDMCSYLLFSLVQLPFFFVSTNRLRYFFVGKCFIVPAVALGMMGYLVRKAGGGGPILAQEATISGQAYSKAWLLSFAAILGNWAPLACNSPDFTRSVP